MTGLLLVSALAWVLVVAQGLVLLEIIRQIGQIRKQLGPGQGALVLPDAIKSGDALPDLSGVKALNGQPAYWDDYIKADVAILLMLTAHCVSCVEIGQGLSGYAAKMKRQVSFAVLLEGPADEIQTFMDETKLDPFLVVIDEDAVTARRLGIKWRPSAVTVKGRAVDEAAVVNSVEQLDAFVNRALYGEANEPTRRGGPMPKNEFLEAIT
jgi:hypothetical protein